MNAMLPLRHGPSGAGRAWAVLRAGFLVLFCTVALADGLEGRFEVRSADLGLKEGVYQMNARLELPVSAAVKKGLADGVPLSLQLELSIERERRLLPNANVAQLTQRYQLQYNAVSARYVLRNVNSGEQASFATVDDALISMSQVRDVPVLDKSFIEPRRHYDASVRAKLDYGAVPMTVRILMFWVNDWHRESEWYTWTLQN
jgi:hypothetical protein